MARRGGVPRALAGALALVMVLVLPAWVLAAGAATGADVDFRGTIVDDQGAPLPGALVYLHGAGRSGRTDPAGGFAFASVEPGDVATVQAAGFATRHVAVPPEGGLDRPVLLEPRGGAPRNDTQLFRGLLGPQTRFEESPRFPAEGLVFPFSVDPGAVGGQLTVTWPPGTPPVYLGAEVIHEATGQRLGLEAPVPPPLVSALPGSWLRDHPGAYRLEVHVAQGATLGLEVQAEVSVAYGTWEPRAVVGAAPEVTSPRGPGATSLTNPNMDILGAAFTNETDGSLDVVLHLYALADLAPASPFTAAQWSVRWNLHGTEAFVALESEAAPGAEPRFRYGTCTPQACVRTAEVPGEVAFGAPATIVFRLPKSLLGAVEDGQRLAQPAARTFQEALGGAGLSAAMQAGTADAAGPGEDYVLGAHRYDFPRGTPAADPGAGLRWDWALLALIPVGAVAAWRARLGARQSPRRYVTLRVLGTGAMGRVVLARHTRLDRLVAIKEVRAAGDPAAEGRLLREARLAAAVQHPNVVQVLDVESGPGGPAIVMEYLPEGSLEEALARGDLGPDGALGVVRDVLAGLAAIHAQGIVHRDLKPRNVLMAGDGTAKIADFGVARSPLEETMGPHAQGVGTPLYMAPEVLRGRPPDQRSDIYAASALAYRVLTGAPHLAMDGPDPWSALLARRARRAALPAPGLPPWLNDLLARGLAEDPRKRPASAAEMLRDLEAHMPRPRRAGASSGLPRG